MNPSLSAVTIAMLTYFLRSMMFQTIGQRWRQKNDGLGVSVGISSRELELEHSFTKWIVTEKDHDLSLFEWAIPLD